MCVESENFNARGQLCSMGRENARCPSEFIQNHSATNVWEGISETSQKPVIPINLAGTCSFGRWVMYHLFTEKYTILQLLAYLHFSSCFFIFIHCLVFELFFAPKIYVCGFWIHIHSESTVVVWRMAIIPLICLLAFTQVSHLEVIWCPMLFRKLNHTNAIGLVNKTPKNCYENEQIMLKRVFEITIVYRAQIPLRFQLVAYFLWCLANIWEIAITSQT